MSKLCPKYVLIMSKIRPQNVLKMIKICSKVSNIYCNVDLKISLKCSKDVQKTRSDICIYGKESQGWISLFKLVTFFFFKFPDTLMFLVKLIS